jgi:hypothetical protein
MIVSAWHDGGGGYGIRVPEDKISLYFRPEWSQVVLHLPGESEKVQIPLSESFWGSAPEIRSSRLRTFFERNGLIPWTKNRPPHFQLEPLGNGEFRLGWLERLGGQASLPLGD